MEIKGLKVLVTGGAGFIGSNLVDDLAKSNQVVILDDFSSGKKENIAHLESKSNVDIVHGDIRDKGLVHDVMKNIDVVFHLAVRCLRVSIKNPEINHEVNVTGTLNLLMASLKHSVKRFVYVSSSEVYGTAQHVPMNEAHPCEPITVYGASKLAGELYALAYYRTYGLPVMVIRPFNTYGPREHLTGVYGEVIPRFVLRILNNLPPVIFGDGKQTRDFTYVSDTVKGMISASACDNLIGEKINIARGQEVSINQLAEVISEKLGRKDLRPVYEQQRPGDVMRHYADTSKARQLVNFNPAVDIQTGISLYIDWFNAQRFDIAELAKQEVLFNW